MAYTTESQALTTTDVAQVANREARTDDAVHSGPLLNEEVTQDMRTRWEAIQTEFVDDPRSSVQRADELVATAIKRLAETFTNERSRLEQQWSKGNDVSTEDMRQALRRYRTFFQRLLTV